MPASLRNEMKWSPATPGSDERVAGQLVGDLEALVARRRRPLDARDRLGRDVDPGHALGDEPQRRRRVRRMQIDGMQRAALA